MASTTPKVEDDLLYTSSGDTASAPIPLGSEQWYAWLELHQTFRVKTSSISYTVRKERRVDKWYWYAYKRIAGKLRITYIGKSEELTPARLEEVAQTFAKTPSSPTDLIPILHTSQKADKPHIVEQNTPVEHMQFATLPDLPTQLTSFVGRTHEIAEALRLLTQTRLLTLSGVGGIGKTRLALQIAYKLHNRFAKEICYIELARISNPAALLPSLATTLGLHQKLEEGLLEALGLFFRRNQALLVLDNCEHLVDVCAPLVAQLLTICPSLHILATSREALGVPGETLLLVPPLSLPVPNESYTLEQVAQSEAVQLFSARVTLLQPSFTLDAENVSAVLRICQHLEGIPLALELVTERVRLMPVTQIADRLEHEIGERLRLLTHNKRTVATRHQTLRATIDWSYQLLSPAEQALLRRLSIFTGGWTLETAEAICTGDNITMEDILDLLAKLVNKSLIQVGEEALPDGTGVAGKYIHARYRMLETIRQYAREKLQIEQKEHALQCQHLAYFCRLAHCAGTKLREAEQLYWLAWLDQEAANIQTALHVAVQQDPVAGRALVSSLAAYWIMRAQFPQGRKWVEEILLCIGEPTDITQARFLHEASLLTFFQGDMQRCAQLSETALTLFRALEYKKGIGQALSIQIEIARQNSAYQQALAMGVECEALLKETGERWMLALAYFSLATIHMHQSDYAMMLSQVAESKRLMQEQGDRWGLALAYSAFGKVTGYAGHAQEAFFYFEEGARLAHEVGDSDLAATHKHALGVLAVIAQDYTSAQRYLEDVRKQYEQSGNLSGLAEAVFYLGLMFSNQGNFPQATHYLELSVQIYTTNGSKSRATLSQYHLGRVAALQHDGPRALAFLREALSTFYQNNQRMFLPGCLKALAALSVFSSPPLLTLQQAALWLGLAQSLDPHAPPPQIKNTLYEETVAAIQIALSADDFAAALAQGKVMTLEQVIQEVHAIRVPKVKGAPSTPYSCAPFGLTTREIEVLRLLATGMSNQEIAHKLSISSGTVRSHLTSIYSHLAVHSRTAAVHTAKAYYLL